MGKSKDREVRGKVFETDNYSQFKTVKGNRPVNEIWVKKLATLIEENAMDDPIKVSSDMKIIDGQHRLAAHQLLGKKIRYEIMDGAEEIDVSNINSDRKKWTSKDYLHFHWVRGNPHYQKLKYLAEDQGLGIENAVLVGQKRCTRDAFIFNEFKSGDYKLKYYSFALQFAKDYNVLIDKLGKVAKKRYFAHIFMIFYRHPDFAFARFIDAVKTNMGRMDHCTDKHATIRIFQEVYNKQLKAKSKYKKIMLQRWIEDGEHKFEGYDS